MTTPTATVHYYPDKYHWDCPRCTLRVFSWDAIPDLEACEGCGLVYEPVDDAWRRAIPPIPD